MSSMLSRCSRMRACFVLAVLAPILAQAQASPSIVVTSIHGVWTSPRGPVKKLMTLRVGDRLTCERPLDVLTISADGTRITYTCTREPVTVSPPPGRPPLSSRWRASLSGSRVAAGAEPRSAVQSRHQSGRAVVSSTAEGLTSHRRSRVWTWMRRASGLNRSPGRQTPSSSLAAGTRGGGSAPSG